MDEARTNNSVRNNDGKRIILLVWHQNVHPNTKIICEMSASKRPASDSFGSSQLVVKRQKSNVDLGDGRALAAKLATGGNGALIQAVCRCSLWRRVLLIEDEIRSREPVDFRRLLWNLQVNQGEPVIYK